MKRMLEPLDKTNFIYTLSDGSTVVKRIFFERATRDKYDIFLERVMRDEYVVEKCHTKITRSSKEIEICPQPTANLNDIEGIAKEEAIDDFATVLLSYTSFCYLHQVFDTK